MVYRKPFTVYFAGRRGFCDFHDSDPGASRRTSCGKPSENSGSDGSSDLYSGKYHPVPFILLFIRQIFKWLKKTRLFCGLITKLENRAMGKSDKIRRYEFWGLLLFVGIPLPGTGAWTGSLIASLLEIDIKKSSVAILGGIIMATVIMYIVSYTFLGNIVH